MEENNELKIELKTYSENVFNAEYDLDWLV